MIYENNKGFFPIIKDINIQIIFKVCIVGAGPVGLRLAIECALLGARCVVVEKRDRLHLY